MRPSFPLLAALLLAAPIAPAAADPASGTATAHGVPIAPLLRDRGVPAPGEGPIPYVIVTTRSLRGEFALLALARFIGGTRSAVRSLEGIREDYPVAADDAERIRRFLADAHAHWGTRWVLLGGDTERIPARHATVRDVLPERAFVSDWYYACLDGTWDGDGDGRYGEPLEDAPDLVPELFVGRAPVVDRAEARRFVRKTLLYERRPDGPFEERTLMFAHRLGPFLDLAASAERLRPLITDDPAQELTRLYESWDDPAWAPGALPETRASVLAALGEGHHVTIGFGGGSVDRLAVGTQTGPDPQYLTVADALGLANGSRTGHLWLLTSWVAAFDAPTSLAEAFVRAPEGGCVTVIAPSDLIFSAPGEQITRRFVEVVFDEGVASIGEALVRARADQAAQAATNPLGAAIVMAYQLLGDPLLPVFRGSAVRAAATDDPRGRTDLLGAGASTGGPDVPLRLAEAAAPAPRVPAGRIALGAPSPQPAGDRMRVTLALAADLAAGPRVAEVLDLAGRRVRVLPADAGGVLEWDLRDADGRRVAPGVYLLRVAAGTAQAVARVVVMPGR